MGNFDWLNGRDYPALTAPDSAYHGITFAETFGKHGYITYCHANVLRDLGPTMSPMNAFLTLTGLETLPLRMRQHNENTQKVANFLNQHKKYLRYHGQAWLKAAIMDWHKNICKAEQVLYLPPP